MATNWAKTQEMEWKEERGLIFQEWVWGTSRTRCVNRASGQNERLIKWQTDFTSATNQKFSNGSNTRIQTIIWKNINSYKSASGLNSWRLDCETQEGSRDWNWKLGHHQCKNDSCHHPLRVGVVRRAVREFFFIACFYNMLSLFEFLINQHTLHFVMFKSLFWKEKNETKRLKPYRNRHYHKISSSNI